MDTDGFLAAVKASDVGKMRAALQAEPKVATTPGKDGLTPLLVAIYHRRRDAVDLLVASGALRSAHEAAALGDLAAVKRLIAADPKVLARAGADGAFPLHLAAHFGHDRIVRELVRLGADVDARCGPFFSNMALHAAAAGRAPSCVRTLLELGATVDARDAGGHTPLHIAAATGDQAILRLLLDAGAGPHARNQAGKTPRDVAADRGVDEVLRLLPAP